MKKILLTALTLIVFTLVCNAESPVALTLRMRGDIDLQRGEDGSKLHEGLALINQDVLNSREGSFAFLKFVDDGATLRLFENTILTINAQKEGDQLNKSSFLSQGNVFSSVNRNRGSYDIETPTTVASVRGTEGFVETKADGSTLIVTLKGEFEVENLISGEKSTVAAGYSCNSGLDGSLEVFPTEEIDEDWLEAIKDMPHGERNILRIELQDQNDESRTIEIELE